MPKTDKSPNLYNTRCIYQIYIAHSSMQDGRSWGHFSQKTYACLSQIPVVLQFRAFNKALGELSTKVIMLSKIFQQKASHFWTDFSKRHFNKKLHPFGEISAKGFMLSEILTKSFIFWRDFNEKLHPFGEISAKGFMLPDRF